MFRHLIDTDDWCNFHSLSSGRFDCRRQPIWLSVLFSDNHDNVNELWTDQIYQKNLFELQRGSLTVLSKSDWYLSADGLRFLMMSFFFIFWKSPIQLLKSPPFLGTFLKWQMRIFWIENGFFSFVIAVYLKFMAYLLSLAKQKSLHLNECNFLRASIKCGKKEKMINHRLNQLQKMSEGHKHTPHSMPQKK